MLKKALVDDRRAAGLVPGGAAAGPGGRRGHSTAHPRGRGTSTRNFSTISSPSAWLTASTTPSRTSPRHSTGHSESIVTENAANAERFVSETDSAAVYVNVSTRFTDGGEFGLGCEMGISTQKLHARGPMGLDELSTYKYIIRGNGQIR